jgi:hypothetical protein
MPSFGLGGRTSALNPRFGAPRRRVRRDGSASRGSSSRVGSSTSMPSFGLGGRTSALQGDRRASNAIAVPRGGRRTPTGAVGRRRTAARAGTSIPNPRFGAPRRRVRRDGSASRGSSPRVGLRRRCRASASEAELRRSKATSGLRRRSRFLGADVEPRPARSDVDEPRHARERRSPIHALERRGVASDATARHSREFAARRLLDVDAELRPRRPNLGAPRRPAGFEGDRGSSGRTSNPDRRASKAIAVPRGGRRARPARSDVDEPAARAGTSIPNPRFGAPRRRVRRDGSASRGSASRVGSSTSMPSFGLGGRTSALQGDRRASKAIAVRRGGRRTPTGGLRRRSRFLGADVETRPARSDVDEPRHARERRSPIHALERRGVASDATARHLAGVRRASDFDVDAELRPRRPNLGAPKRPAGFEGDRGSSGRTSSPDRRASNAIAIPRGGRRAPSGAVGRRRTRGARGNVDPQSTRWSAEASRPTRRLGISREFAARRLLDVDAELRPRRPNLGAPKRRGGRGERRMRVGGASSARA